MKTKIICVLALMVGSVGVLAQTNSTSSIEEPLNDWQPAASNQQGKQ